SAKSTWGGRKVNCPHCKQPIFIPQQPNPAPAEIGLPGLPFAPIVDNEPIRPESPVVESKTMLGTFDPVSAPPTVDFFCPACNGQVKGIAGEKIHCPKCAQKLKVPAPPPLAMTVLGSLEPVVPPPSPYILPAPQPDDPIDAYPVLGPVEPIDAYPVSEIVDGAMPDWPPPKEHSDRTWLFVSLGIFCFVIVGLV